MNKRLLNFLLYGIICVSFIQAHALDKCLHVFHTHQAGDRKIEYFKLQEVRLLESPFKHAQDLNKAYLLELEPDRLLAPFLREAGLTPKSESYPNWESTGLDGHIGGHYLSALSLMYASTGDNLIKERLDYMIKELKRCQDANGNGYIGGVPGGKVIWDEVAKGNIRAGGFELNGKWVPLYNIHKTYAGLRDACLVAGNKDALDLLVKMTDWAIKLVEGLSDEQIQNMLRSEHGGLNETFADVAAITGDERYLDLARKFSHRSILNPLLEHKDELTGMHANTQIPKVLGYKRIAELENNADWEEAARFFWETVVENRSVVIGGNSVAEHFNPIDDFSRMISSVEGPETCNTYNMLRLTRMLYGTSKDIKYIDYYERSLYNHILATQNNHSGGLVYFTPMRPGHYRVYSQPQTSMWCCVGSGIENHSKYGEMIYAKSDREIVVNLFIPSSVEWKEQNVELIQETNFPYDPTTTITVKPKRSKQFVLSLRVPSWTNHAGVEVKVNDKVLPAEVIDGYVSIDRKWKKGDRVEMIMPMSLQTAQLPDRSAYYAFTYGPIVLAAKMGTENQKGLWADDSRGGHIATGKQIPLDEMPILVGEPNQLVSQLAPVSGKPLTFKLKGLYPEKYDNGIELIPFFNIHEARYTIYWPQATKEEVEKIRLEQEKKEKEYLALEAITLDKVTCGEQQPESDHFVKADDSKTGVFEDTRWREANGWFAYKLKNNMRTARAIYITYFDGDRSRNFDVLVNDMRVKALSLTGRNGKDLQEVMIELPKELQNQKELTVKFMAMPGSATAKVASVRLLAEYRAQPHYVAYLFTYFTGNNVEEEAIRFGISSDGYNFYALNNNNPVIDSKKISSTGGVRDPHILRGEDGKTFYMVVTDMTSSKGWDSNRAMILLKSTDLINWSSSIINIQKKYEGQEELKRVWAPQTIYDPEVGKYMVYWSMKHGDGPDIIYYAYANEDFTDLEGEPKPLFLPENGKSCIDGDIIFKDGVFYMFYKTEGHGNGIKLATTKSLTSGVWTEYPDYKQQTKDAVEGSSVFKRIDSDTYVLMYDVYTKGAYQFTESIDLMNFKVIDHQISMDFHPRHGSIIPVTQDELDRMISKWGKPEKFYPTVGHNPILKGFFADPYAMYSNKTKKYYIYPTSDGYTGWSGTYFKTFSSENLIDWKDEGVILDLKKDVSWADRNAWAPCIIEKKTDNGYKYYYYFTAAQKIGVAVADDPTGPFLDSGKPLIDFKPQGVSGGQEIDPDVFCDPVTGKNYLYWGNGYMAVVELNDDMVSFKPNTLKVMTPDQTFREAIHLFYRNGIYYFLWSEDDTRSENYRVRYAMSKSPMGPLEIPEDNLILSKKVDDGIYGTGHNSTLKINGKDEWYIVYHRFFRPDGINWGDAAGYHREVCIDPMEFNADGTIRPIVPTP